MPTVYAVLSRTGSGRSEETPIEPLVHKGFEGHITTVFNAHPDRVICRVSAEQPQLDTLLSLRGVLGFGETVARVHNWMDAGGIKIAREFKESRNDLFQSLRRRGRLILTPRDTLQEHRRAITGWADWEVQRLLSNRPLNVPLDRWHKHVASIYSMTHLDIRRLLGGKTVIASETWDIADQSGWGGIDEAWLVTGTTQPLDILGNEGRVTWASNGYQWEYINVTDAEDVESTVAFNVTSTGNNTGLMHRFQSGAIDCYMLRIKTPESSGSQVNVYQIISDSWTSLDSQTSFGIIDPGFMKFYTKANGAATDIKWKIWTGAEPGWDAEFTDSGSLDGTAGKIGLHTHLKSSTARTFLYNNYSANDLNGGAGTQTVTPDAVVVNITMPAPQAANAALLPDAVTVSITVPDPNVFLSLQTVTPDAVPVNITIPDPAVTVAGAVTGLGVVQVVGRIHRPRGLRQVDRGGGSVRRY